MAAGPETLLRYIRELVARPRLDETSDAALLDRFVSARDQTAFAALVDRHGPLVFHVCRRVLGNIHDAEDAFQAAFLVLARKAATVRPRERLPAWLHGVARRVALKARSAKIRQCRDSGALDVSVADPRPDPLADLSVRELLLMVDEELERLPEAYRLPVILCCLEGRSLEEAARQLGWTLGSVKGRLERGRARLHQRLLRRGVTLSAALAAAEVSQGAASAAVVAQLAAATVRGALAFAARQTVAAQGVPSGAAALASDVIRGMAAAKLKTATMLVLALGLLATGLLTYRAASARSTAAPQPESWLLPSDGKPAPAAPAAVLSNQPGDRGDWPDSPIAVSGRVLDPEGRPFARAKVYVGYTVRRYIADSQLRQPMPLLRTTTRADGRFQFAFARSELNARWLDDSRPAVIAVAEGYGPDWVEIKESAESAEVSLNLVRDNPIEGRILTHDKKPVADARIRVWEVRSYSEAALTHLLQGEAADASGSVWRGPLPGLLPQVTTTADGRFRVSGLGRDRMVTLLLEGPDVQRTLLWAATRPRPAVPVPVQFHLASFDYVAPACRAIRGVVRDQATGQPVAGVTISAQGSMHTSVTDNTGGYEVLVSPQAPGWNLMAQPENGQPYFAASVWVPDKPGSDAIVANVDLVSGILLHGRVTDEATRKPPRAAVMEYYPLFPNAHSSRITNGSVAAASSCLVQPNGSYRLAVLPGPGVVCLAASPRDWYAVAIVEDKELATLVKDGINHERGHNPRTAVGADAQGIVCLNRYNGLSLINPDEGSASLALDVTLQAARPIKGTVVGPEGKPLTGVRVVGLTAFPEDEVLDSASFTVGGLNPRRRRDLIFYDRAHGLGKALAVRVDQTEPLTVQLESCGSVVGRLVDKGGKPVPGVRVSLQGKNSGAGASAETDGQGRFRVALVPRRKYWFGLFAPRQLLRSVPEVEVESGQLKELGDLPVGD